MQQNVFTDSPGKVLVQLVVPIAVGFVMLMVIDFADMVVGRMLSNEVVAILGYCYPLLYFMIAMGFGLNQGLTITGAEAYVGQNARDLYAMFVQSVVISGLMAMFLQILTLGFVHLELIDPTFMPHLATISVYLYTIVSAIFPMFLLLLICSLCQIKGQPDIIRDTLFLMLILTGILHPILALPFGLGWGIIGIAISKVLVILLGCFYAGCKIIDWSEFRQSDWRLHGGKMRELAAQAVPAVCIQLLVPVYLIMLTSVIARFGVETLAGFSLGYRIVMMVVIPILGVLVALLVVITHDYVHHQYARVKESLRLSLMWGSAIILSVLLSAYVAAYLFFHYVSTYGRAEDIALQYLLLALYITVLEYLMGVCVVSFQAVKRPLIAFGVAFIRTIGCPLPVFYLLTRVTFDVHDLWAGLFISFTLSGIFALLVGYYQFWQKMPVVYQSNNGIE